MLKQACHFIIFFPSMFEIQVMNMEGMRVWALLKNFQKFVSAVCSLGRQWAGL